MQANLQFTLRQHLCDNFFHTMSALNKSNFQSDFFPLLKVMQAGQVQFFSRGQVSQGDMQYCMHHLTLAVLNTEFLRKLLQKSVELMSRYGLKSQSLQTKEKVSYHPLDLNIRALNLPEIDDPDIHKLYEQIIENDEEA